MCVHEHHARGLVSCGPDGKQMPHGNKREPERGQAGSYGRCTKHKPSASSRTKVSGLGTCTVGVAHVSMAGMGSEANSRRLLSRTRRGLRSSSQKRQAARESALATKLEPVTVVAEPPNSGPNDGACTKKTVTQNKTLIARNDKSLIW
jgi:hypothetical protein